MCLLDGPGLAHAGRVVLVLEHQIQMMRAQIELHTPKESKNVQHTRVSKMSIVFIRVKWKIKTRGGTRTCKWTHDHCHDARRQVLEHASRGPWIQQPIREDNIRACAQSQPAVIPASPTRLASSSRGKQYIESQRLTTAPTSKSGVLTRPASGTRGRRGQGSLTHPAARPGSRE